MSKKPQPISVGELPPAARRVFFALIEQDRERQQPKPPPR